MRSRCAAAVTALALLLLLTAAACAGPAARPDPGFAISLESQPAPMQSGRVATVTIRVNQADGAPLAGARVSFIPEHTGMSMGRPTVATQEREPGVYSAEHMPSMAGAYRFTVKVEAAQGQAERVLDVSVR